MKKLFYILVSAILLTACETDDWVAPITPQDDPLSDIIRIAQEGAMMLEDATTRTSVARRIDRGRISCKVNPATRAGVSDDTLYYVVNYADNAGFAIVSANDDAPDGARLIAVTEAGCYTAGEETDNEGFNMFLQMLANSRGIIGDVEIDSLPMPELGNEVVEEYYSNWTSKGPYVQMKWGQGVRSNNVYNPQFPYNYYCYNSKTELCPAGCVAVALAQIMSYHKKPVAYNITWNGTHATRVINWQSLCSYPGSPVGMSWSTSAIDNIAMLLREIGAKAGMSYAPNGSGATIQGARASLAGFGYAQNPEQDHNIAVIRSELNAGRPVCEFGQGYVTDSDGNVQLAGHAWVIDGYKSRVHHYKRYMEYKGVILAVLEETETTYNYLHVNWGYDGRNNGYFLNGVFDLQQEYDYDYDIAIWNDLVYDFRYGNKIVTGIVNNNSN